MRRAVRVCNGEGGGGGQGPVKRLLGADVATRARVEARCGGDNVVSEQMRGNLVRDPVPPLPLRSHVLLPAHARGDEETGGREGARGIGRGREEKRQEASEGVRGRKETVGEGPRKATREAQTGRWQQGVGQSTEGQGTQIRQKRPIIMQKRPIIRQKRPVIRQKRPTNTEGQGTLVALVLPKP